MLLEQIMKHILSYFVEKVSQIVHKAVYENQRMQYTLR